MYYATLKINPNGPGAFPIITLDEAQLSQKVKNGTMPYLRYWCSMYGELTQPREEIPHSIIRLYEKHQNACDGMNLFTVTLNGVNGMLFTLLLDDDWVDEIGAGDSLKDYMHCAIDRLIHENRIPVGVDVLLMMNSDANGSEIGFFFREDQCDKVAKFMTNAPDLSEIIYAYIEQAV